MEHKTLKLLYRVMPFVAAAVLLPTLVAVFTGLWPLSAVTFWVISAGFMLWGLTTSQVHLAKDDVVRIIASSFAFFGVLFVGVISIWFFVFASFDASEQIISGVTTSIGIGMALSILVSHRLEEFLFRKRIQAWENARLYRKTAERYVDLCDDPFIRNNFANGNFINLWPQVNNSTIPLETLCAVVNHAERALAAHKKEQDARVQARQAEEEMAEELTRMNNCAGKYLESL